MIEPTESEPKSEIDRFRKATIGIRREIAAVESDHVAIEHSPLRHAAHIGHDRVDAEWNHPYSREQPESPTGVLPPTRSSARSAAWTIAIVIGNSSATGRCPAPDAHRDEAA